MIGVLETLCREMSEDPAYASRIFASDVMGIERLDESAVIVRVTLRTQPQERWAVAREFRRRVLKAFRSSGIEIPFPHLAIRLSGAMAGRLAEAGSESTVGAAGPTVEIGPKS